MSNQTPKNWWEKKRPQYNKGLIVAGATAYIIFIIMEGHKNFTLFVLFFQGIGSLFILGFANLFYFLGRFADYLFNKTDSEVFRKRLFNFGFGFSILLPFVLPVLFIFFPAWDAGYDQLKSVPTDNELCGVYELNNGSKQFLINHGYNIDNSRLELIADKQYHFYKLPDNVLDGFGRSNGKTIDQSGKWNIYCPNGSDCQIEMEHTAFGDIGLKNNRLSILITIGDPDSREGIVYEKVNK